MDAVKSANLALRFLLELCVLLALGYWGFTTTGTTLARIGLGIGLPLLAAVVWGTLIAPKAPVKLATPLRVLVELVIFRDGCRQGLPRHPGRLPVHRAAPSLGPDAEFRFVNVAEWASPAAAFQAATAPPGFPGRGLPFPAHPALYEVVAEDRPPGDDPGGVVLVNAFEVPPGGDDAFLAAWEGTRQFLRGQPGYLATRLHRSLSPEADFRFVNVGRYESPQAFQAAVGQPGFRQAAAAIQHRAHPSLYEVVRR